MVRPRGRERRLILTPMTRTSWLLATTAVVATTTLACTAKAPGDQFEKKIIEWGKANGAEMAKATCPKSIKVEVDATFTCTATLVNGDELTMAGKVTSKSGSNFEYSIKPVEPTYYAEKAATYLGEALTEQTGVKPKAVECGAPGLRRIPTDLKITCSATDPEDRTTKFDFVFKADGAIDRWAAQQ